MNLDQINQELADLANCGDPTFTQAAAYVASLAAQAQAGQMAPEEMAELLKDVQRQMNVIDQMSQLEFKEKLNTLINGLIKLAGLV
jgi:membrane-bound lytic murein transglycosylase B